MRLNGPHNWFGRYGEIKILDPLLFEIRFVKLSPNNLVVRRQ
jgi:hypothetical protein